jgi:hypothetical protein
MKPAKQIVFLVDVDDTLQENDRGPLPAPLLS